MSHDQKRQYCNLQGESQAQREEQEQMESSLPVAEVEESKDNSPSSSASPSLSGEIPAGGIPKFHQSPQGAASHPTDMAFIPTSPSDEASCNLRLRAKVPELVQFLLLKYSEKELTTKAEMIEHVIKEDAQHYDRILNDASEGLKLVFGLDILEVDPFVHTYGVVTALGLTYDGMHTDVQGMPKTGILIIALGVICEHGDRVSENVIWQTLNMMGLSPSEYHYIAGDVKKLFTETFVLEGYLEYNPVPGSDPIHYEFLWGPRAYAETTSVEVLEFLAEFSRIN